MWVLAAGKGEERKHAWEQMVVKLKFVLLQQPSQPGDLQMFCTTAPIIPDHGPWWLGLMGIRVQQYLKAVGMGKAAEELFLPL